MQLSKHDCRKNKAINAQKYSEAIQKVGTEGDNVEKYMNIIDEGADYAVHEFVMIKSFLAILLVCCLLCGCSQERINHTDSSEQAAGYFFPQEVVSREYTATFSGFSGQSEQKAVTLLVTEVQHFQEGILYELKVDCDEEEPDRYEEYRGEWWYLGLFFVQGEEIYFIRDNEVRNKFQSAEEIQNAGTLVCNEAGKEDTLGEDKKGWHESIVVDGDRREYHAYSNLVETGYYECFVWEAGRGLVGYWSGYGARSNDIELYLSEEKSLREPTGNQ